MHLPGAERRHCEKPSEDRSHGDEHGDGGRLARHERLILEPARKAEKRHGDFVPEGPGVKVLRRDEDEKPVGEHRAKRNDCPGAHAVGVEHLGAYEGETPADHDEKREKVVGEVAHAGIPLFFAAIL